MTCAVDVETCDSLFVKGENWLLIACSHSGQYSMDMSHDVNTLCSH